MLQEIGLSYWLLHEAAKECLLGVSVFIGGFTLEAARVVLERLDGSGGTATLEELQSLMDKSLLKVDEIDGEPRFRFLNTVRDCASSRLR